MSEFILINEIEAQAAAQGDKTALVYKDRVTGYGALSGLSNQVAQQLLSAAIKPHARIAFMGANSTFISSFFSVCKKCAAFWSASIRGLPVRKSLMC